MLVRAAICAKLGLSISAASLLRATDVPYCVVRTNTIWLGTWDTDGLMARGRSGWGATRKLPSGRWQARYRINRELHPAPSTFRTKRDAEAFLATVRADIERGTWVDPAPTTTTLRAFADTWMEQRHDLRPRTRELYESELRLHILPALGDTPLAELSTPAVRAWHARMIKRGTPGRTTVAKCYRLLRTILGTAVEDGLIVKNPCVIKGAGVERTPERPTATVQQVYTLADKIDPRYRALVLTAAFTGLRLGELRGLRRHRVDLDKRRIDVVEQIQEVRGGDPIAGPPKSDAGIRTVAIPVALADELRSHLSRWTSADRDALVFPGPGGDWLRRATLNKAWAKAREASGMDGFRFHDLRHTGNTLAASTGASTKELMARLGHASPRAALIYQHASEDRDQAIARALDDMIDEGLSA